MIRLTCPNCSSETPIQSRAERDCDHCGEEVPMEAITNYVVRAERSGVPHEPTGYNS